jgi:ABC-type Fe3+ transport system substrate-binding protein
MALRGVSSKSKISRRQLLRGLGGIACGAAALPVLNARRIATVAAAEKQIVSVMGAPGLHQEVWKEWTNMVLADSKGTVELRYEPLGYAPAFAKVKTEAEANHHTIDIFYGDAPYPHLLANEGLLEPLPYADMPNTKELWDFARKKFMIEVFHTHWGVVGYNTKFLKGTEFNRPVSWEEFTDPKWKGKLGWPDPRSFQAELPAIFLIYGDKWLDYMKRVDKNVSNYYSRWIDNRIANQKGDTQLSIHCMETVYIGAEVDKAPMRGALITSPKPGLCALEVSMGVVKGAPARDAAFKAMDMLCSAKYTKVLMDKGLNPSNNAKNYPHNMPNKILEVNSAKDVGIDKWEDLKTFLLPVDWSEMAKKMPTYLKQWEDEVLKKR